ncbi:hypothetical protein BKA93DRAFT_216465 [Sparassis latifolia]
MALPLSWITEYNFSPISSTSAVCLTRDLAPEEPADILLLGCGDSSSILYTIFYEPDSGCRRLDFTCCDLDPAILARNVLLFTMIADGEYDTSIIWNVFFHVYLDEDAFVALIVQCEKLYDFSESLQHWNASPYGLFLIMCTEHTLERLRYHWYLYMHMHELSSERLDTLRDAFAETSDLPLEETLQLRWNCMRSAGPLKFPANLLNLIFELYRKIGMPSFDPDQYERSTALNPTFVYSLQGLEFNIDMVTHPLNPFHLAVIIANGSKSMSLDELVEGAQTQFSEWSAAYSAAIHSTATPIPVVRLFLSEATAACRALRAAGTTGTLDSEPVGHWTTQRIRLNKDQYRPGGAPVRFNVIHTSNLEDHIGLLNLMISAIPVMSSALSSVLYTESLKSRAKGDGQPMVYEDGEEKHLPLEDGAEDFTKRLYAEMSTMSLLLGVCPVDYLSRFTTRSNTHEVMLHTEHRQRGTKSSFLQVMTWKYAASGDTSAARNVDTGYPVLAGVLKFDPCQLGTLLSHIYRRIFLTHQQDNIAEFSGELDEQQRKNALTSESNIVFHTRESFILFLKFVKDRHCISDEQWEQVMDVFIDIHRHGDFLTSDDQFQHELYSQLHLHRLYRMSTVQDDVSNISFLSEWQSVAPIVRIFLIVPRERLTFFAEIVEGSGVNVVNLQCNVVGKHIHSTFSSVRAAFGSAIRTGANAHPSVLVEEDPSGWDGTSPLVASFAVPTRLLAVEDVEDILISFSARVALGTVVLLAQELGSHLNLFTARLTDEAHVIISPEEPPLLEKTSDTSPRSSPRGLLLQMGLPGGVSVTLDEQCERISSLTCSVAVEDEEVKHLLRSCQETPWAKQISPCTVRVNMVRYSQDMVYPFPVMGYEPKVHCTDMRDAFRVEVTVPPSGPDKLDGIRLTPFPIVHTGDGPRIRLWNVHYVNLDRSPVLDLTDLEHTRLWLHHHVRFTNSTRDHKILVKHCRDETASTPADNLTLLKKTINWMFLHASGLMTFGRIFPLYDKSTPNIVVHTIFFISELRFDLHSHTVICDGYVLSMTAQILAIPRMLELFKKLILGTHRLVVDKRETQAWKHLLPALVERCRISWQHGDNCEYKAQDRIPLTIHSYADPVCSCGRGNHVEGMSAFGEWCEFAPYVSRIALSPLFAVTWLETLGQILETHKCFACGQPGRPRLMTCMRCKSVRYCSRECQKKDWKADHKSRCRPQGVLSY